MINKTEPKIVLLDIETLPNLQEVMKVFPGLSAYPGLTLKASINSIICFGYQVFGESEIKCINAWDFKSWRRNVNDDKGVCEKIIEILEDVDCVITHNGKRFDWKFIQTRILFHKLKPLPKIIHIDTCQVSKSHLLMFNNKLNTLGKYLTSEEKLENGGWDLWTRVMNREKKAMLLMTDYCKQDVNLLNKIYKILRPFINNIPNYNLLKAYDINICPSCGSTRIINRGFSHQKETIKKRYSCNDCGSWHLIGKNAKNPRGL